MKHLLFFFFFRALWAHLVHYWPSNWHFKKRSFLLGWDMESDGKTLFSCSLKSILEILDMKCWTYWLWFSWFFTGNRENLAASQGKKKIPKGRGTASLEESRYFSPGVSSSKPVSVPHLPLWQVSLQVLSQTWFHWHLPVTLPGRSVNCPWAEKNTETQRNKCSAHIFSKRKIESKKCEYQTLGLELKFEERH